MFMLLNSLKRAFQIGGQSIISKKIVCTRWANCTCWEWLYGSVLCVFLGSPEETSLLLLLKGKVVGWAQGQKVPAVPQVCSHSYNWNMALCCLPLTPLSVGFSLGSVAGGEGCVFLLKLKWAFDSSFHMLCILDHPHHRCSAPCIKTGFQLIRLQHLTLKGKQIKSLSWGYNASFSPLWLCIIFFCIWSHHQNLTSCICVC